LDFVSLKSGELGPNFPQKILCIGQNHIFQLEIWRNLLHKQGVCQSHCGLAIYIKKYLKAKEEELWKLKIDFTMQKYINLQKKSSKRNQNPSRYYNNNSITNLKFQRKPNMIIFLKNPHIKK
jgi:hypothetical protein